MAPTLTPDRIGAAIAAVQAAAPVEVQVPVGPDRFVMLAVPADMNLAEVLVFVGFLTAGGLARTLAAAREQAERPQIEIARAMPT